MIISYLSPFSTISLEKMRDDFTIPPSHLPSSSSSSFYWSIDEIEEILSSLISSHSSSTIFSSLNGKIDYSNKIFISESYLPSYLSLISSSSSHKSPSNDQNQNSSFSHNLPSNDLHSSHINHVMNECLKLGKK